MWMTGKRKRSTTPAAYLRKELLTSPTPTRLYCTHLAISAEDRDLLPSQDRLSVLCWRKTKILVAASGPFHVVVMQEAGGPWEEPFVCEGFPMYHQERHGDNVCSTGAPPRAVRCFRCCTASHIKATTNGECEPSPQGRTKETGYCVFTLAHGHHCAPALPGTLSGSSSSGNTAQLHGTQGRRPPGYLNLGENSAPS